MALNLVKNSFGPPSVCRSFPINTVAVLHDTDAPAGCKHLPSGIIIESGASLVFLDADGTTITMVVPATALGLWLPIAPAALTGANACVVKVFWHRGTK